LTGHDNDHRRKDGNAVGKRQRRRYSRIRVRLPEAQLSGGGLRDDFEARESRYI